MDNSVRCRKYAITTDRKPVKNSDESGGSTMKKIHGETKKRALVLCMLIATLFGSAVAKADAVLDWNAIAVNTAIANKQNPFAQARSAAIVQLAVFESVNAITGEYHPYLGTIVAPPGACPEAAAIQAPSCVLTTSFP